MKRERALKKILRRDDSSLSIQNLTGGTRERQGRKISEIVDKKPAMRKVEKERREHHVGLLSLQNGEWGT